MLIQDKQKLEQALEMRNEMLQEIRDEIKSSESLIDNAILTAARSQVAKKYSDIAWRLGVEIVWGSGGAQTARMRRLDDEGKQYLWVSSEAISKAKDFENGF